MWRARYLLLNKRAPFSSGGQHAHIYINGKIFTNINKGQRELIFLDKEKKGFPYNE